MQSDRIMDEILPSIRFLHIGLEYICLPSAWSIAPYVSGNKIKKT